jgi:hypothetical protein
MARTPRKGDKVSWATAQGRTEGAVETALHEPGKQKA